MIGLCPTTVTRLIDHWVWEWVWVSGIDLTPRRREGRRSVRLKLGIGVGNVLIRRKGVGEFGSVLLRHELARDGARRFRIGKGCSGMILMTQEWHRQVGVGQIGVGSVMVVTATSTAKTQDNTGIV